MKPDPRFLNQPKHFWANVRSISQRVGYTSRGTGQIFVPDLPKIVEALAELGLDSAHVAGRSGEPTKLGGSLCEYFAYRADVLSKSVEPRT